MRDLNVAVVEGRQVIDAAGHEIFYRLYGSGEETLVCLHPGPGGGSRIIEPVAEPLVGLVEQGLKVLIYDQLGCGQSDRPKDDSLWTVERFVAELEEIRQRMNLGRIHLYGFSWGSMLALAYTLAHPSAVNSLILSNAIASFPRLVQEVWRLRIDTGPEAFIKLLKHEAAGDYENPDYLEITDALFAKFVRRTATLPFDLERSIAEYQETIGSVLGDSNDSGGRYPPGDTYRVMYGNTSWTPSGSLFDFDVTDRLHEIKVPTLILCGWYDPVTPELHRDLADNIPRNEFVILGHSSHVPFMENEKHPYLAVIADFVARARAEVASKAAGQKANKTAVGT